MGRVQCRTSRLTPSYDNFKTVNVLLNVRALVKSIEGAERSVSRFRTVRNRVTPLTDSNEHVWSDEDLRPGDPG